jgi:MFS family permease
MQLVAPDILSDACGLSVGLVVVGIFVGLALWLFGWRCHRFWIVLITTVLAGVYGLYDAAIFRAQPLLAAVLLAFIGGLLSLALVRVLAFLAGGMVGLLAAQAIFPSFDQPICFLVFGLVSLFLFRLSMMVLTSLAGTILISYATLSLLNHYTTLDAVSWAGQSTLLLNGMVGFVTLLGFGFQLFFDNRRAKRNEDKAKDFSSWDVLLGRGIKWGAPKKEKKKAG